MKKIPVINFLLFGLLTIVTPISGSPIINKGGDDDKPGIIKGEVIDESTGKPMEYANVAVYSKSDSALISGGITDPQGKFEINGISFGDYYLTANFIGYKKLKINNVNLDNSTPVLNLGQIKLAASDQVLGTVNIVANKNPIEYKLDKKVVNVSQMDNAVGGTAVDVLENTPSVQVDIDGNVTLRGSSNFTVYIDGRPSVLSGSEALQQIPASALQTIEIITNPSAKYDPDGTAGIINLVTKKNSLKGFNGIVNASAGTRNKYRGDMTLNYRTKKFNLFINPDWRNETNYGSMISNRESYSGDTTSYLDIRGNRDFKRSGHNYKAGADLYLSDKTTLTISGVSGTSKNNRTGDGKTHSYTDPATPDIFSVTEQNSDSKNNFYNGNINLQHKFNDKGHEIQALAYYSKRNGSDIEEQGEFLSDPQYMKTDTYLDRVQTTNDENEKELRLKVDYTLPINNIEKFEAGYESRFNKQLQNTNLEDYNQLTDTWTINDLFSSSVNFRRDIHALYATYSNKFGNFEYMGGLRGELTVRKIYDSGQNTTSTLDRFDLFPTLHLSYDIGEKNQLMASYSRRINRPRGRNLDPVPDYIDQYTVRIGNPALKPEYTNSYEFSFMKRFGNQGSYLSVEGFDRITNNNINWIQTLGNDGIYYQTFSNFNKNYSAGVEFDGNVNFTKWLLVNPNVSIYNYRIRGDINGVSVDRTSTNWDGRLNATVKFSPNSRMQFMGYYRGKSVSAQGEQKAFFFSNMSYRHDFFKKQLTATLSVRDPFGTARWHGDSYGPDFKSYFQWKREPRVVMLTLSYKINNYKSQDKNDKNPNNNNDNNNVPGNGDINLGGQYQQ